MRTLTARLLGSARLSPGAYEDVEADRHANLQAFMVVILSNLAAALGTGIRDTANAVAFLIFFTVTWVIWVLLTLVIGTQLLPDKNTRADFGEVFRTTGFSATPGILRIFGLIPGIGMFLFFGATIWMLFSFVVAIRQAFDYESTARALAVSILGWMIHGLLFFGFVMTAL
jgi:hypothetical protein